MVPVFPIKITVPSRNHLDDEALKAQREQSKNNVTRSLRSVLFHMAACGACLVLALSYAYFRLPYRHGVAILLCVTSGVIALAGQLRMFPFIWDCKDLEQVENEMVRRGLLPDPNAKPRP